MTLRRGFTRWGFSIIGAKLANAPTAAYAREVLEIGTGGQVVVPTTHGPQEWMPNFSEAAEVRIRAREAMTIAEVGRSGSGTIVYRKNTVAAPGTFTETTSPIFLEEGAWLEVAASNVTGIIAVALERVG